MQNLDKLEQDMQVDRCAEIIRDKEERDRKEIERRHGPQPRKAIKMDKYVFTIKIIEAEDLKACDINGFSDPYVVLGDEFQKRLAKTRIVYRNLNPRWDETVDIVTTGALNIVATIWDWDALGDHDCVGRTSLKLDPSMFRDFMPREFWQDLDTQGRLLLRVSMEGERDDIQFYFGKAFRALKRTLRDMTRSITDKLSAYIRYILSRERLKSLLSKGITGSVSSAINSYFGRNRANTASSVPITQAEIENAITPLTDYFDENFAIMKQTLTDSAMIMVMTRLWKETLMTIEGLLVPPMSDKLSQQKPLNQQELDIVFKWLQVCRPRTRSGRAY
jgi:C2 domain-containing protein